MGCKKGFEGSGKLQVDSKSTEQQKSRELKFSVEKQKAPTLRHPEPQRPPFDPLKDLGFRFRDSGLGVWGFRVSGPVFQLHFFQGLRLRAGAGGALDGVWGCLSSLGFGCWVLGFNEF